MIHTYGFHKLDSQEDDLLKIAKKEDNTGKKAAAIAGGTVVGGLPGAYSAYKGAKDKEEGKNKIGTHAAGTAAAYGTLGAAGGTAAGAVKNNMRRSTNSAKTFGKASKSTMKKKGLKTLAKNGLGGAVLAGLTGAASGAASYGIGRLASKDKQDK